MKIHSEVINRAGCSYHYTLKEGEKWTVFEGKIIIAHADYPPKIIHGNGTVEEIKLGVK